MAGMLKMRRSRGAASGFLLVLLGAWGALIPFIGPYFHYAYTPDTAWTYNTARLWLEVLPGAAVFLGGLLLIIATGRHIALFGAILAAAAGAWFTLGTIVSPLWNNHVTLGGSPTGATQFRQIMEQLGFFTALGLVIVFIAAAAFGRIMSVASGIRVVETESVTETIPAAETEPVTSGPVTSGPVTSGPVTSGPVTSGRTLRVPFRRARTETTAARQGREAEKETIS